MVNFKLWLKKLYFYRKKSILLFFFIILPLILFCSVVINFLNGYFESFEEFSHLNVGPDITVYSRDYNNFQVFHNKAENILENRPYTGSVANLDSTLKVNLTAYNLSGHFSSYYINQSIQYKGLNFSSNRVKDFYINTYMPLIIGKLPQNANEIIVPFKFTEIYNFSLNSLINLQNNEEINLNITIVGFYESNMNTILSSKNSFIFLINDLNDLIFLKYKDFRYYIYLDHRHMDIFNIYSFRSEITQIETLIRKGFSDYIESDESVGSSSSMYQTFEFNEYINNVIPDLFSVVAPILIIIIIFSTISSDYISNIERDYWNKIKIYSSEKNIISQILLEILLNNFIGYLIAFPTAIGLYLLVFQVINFSFGESILYLPNSYFILTFSFSIFYSLLIYIFIIKKYKKKTASSKKISQKYLTNFPIDFRKIIIVILATFAFLPILNKIIQFGLINFYNPLLTSFYTPLNDLVAIISLFYSTIFILLIIFIIPALIIKFIQFFIKKIPFKRLKNQKFELLGKIFQFKNKSTLILITIIGLELGFINYYHFKNYNQYKQKEFEIYSNYGSDFKIYEPYSNKSLINLSNYTEDMNYCQIKSIPGKINNNTIFDQNIVLLTFNSNKYYSTLNIKIQDTINSELISSINSLNANEIIVPIYLQLRYNLKVGDSLVIQPENTTNTNYNHEFIERYEKTMYIKGFFNFLPGLDQDPEFFRILWFEKKLIIITNPNFNFHTEFLNLPIKHTYLVKQFNNCLNIIKTLNNNDPEIYYTSLEDGLNNYYKSYYAVSNKSIFTIYIIFIISFVLMGFLFIYNFISENSDFWNLFQLFGLKEKDIKIFILGSLIGIFTISFLIGLTGIMVGILIFSLENLTFKFNYYFYPIQLYFDPVGLVFNILFIVVSFFIIWLLVYKIMKFTLKYEDFRKYNPQ